jgi:hypothetical protein
MKNLLAFVSCVLLISCAPTPQAGQSYQEIATGKTIKVEAVGNLAEINKYIADDQGSLTYPGRTPHFGTQMPGGTPDPGDECVVYKVVTPAPDPSMPSTIDYYVYKKLVFTKAFTKIAE